MGGAAHRRRSARRRAAAQHPRHRPWPPGAAADDRPPQPGRADRHRRRGSRPRSRRTAAAAAPQPPPAPDSAAATRGLTKRSRGAQMPDTGPESLGVVATEARPRGPLPRRGPQRARRLPGRRSSTAAGRADDAITRRRARGRRPGRPRRRAPAPVAGRRRASAEAAAGPAPVAVEVATGRRTERRAAACQVAPGRATAGSPAGSRGEHDRHRSRRHGRAGRRDPIGGRGALGPVELPAGQSQAARRDTPDDNGNQ